MSSRACMARRVGCCSSWHRLIAARTSSSAPRSRHDPSCGRVADYANPRASRHGLGLWKQYRNQTGHVHATTALIDGRNGPRPVSSDASLNHPAKHCHIAAGRCIAFETMRRGVSAARPGRPPWGPAVSESKSPYRQQFSSPEQGGHQPQVTPYS